MKPSETFRRAIASCPYKPTDPHFSTWIADKIDELEQLTKDILDIKTQKTKEYERHRDNISKLNIKLKELQKKCQHEMLTGAPNCDPVCKYCDYVEHVQHCGYDG